MFVRYVRFRSLIQTVHLNLLFICVSFGSVSVFLLLVFSGCMESSPNSVLDALFHCELESICLEVRATPFLVLALRSVLSYRLVAWWFPYEDLIFRGVLLMERCWCYGFLNYELIWVVFVNKVEIFFYRGIRSSCTELHPLVVCHMLWMLVAIVFGLPPIFNNLWLVKLCFSSMDFVSNYAFDLVFKLDLNLSINRMVRFLCWKLSSKTFISLLWPTHVMFRNFSFDLSYYSSKRSLLALPKYIIKIYLIMIYLFLKVWFEDHLAFIYRGEEDLFWQMFLIISFDNTIFVVAILLFLIWATAPTVLVLYHALDLSYGLKSSEVKIIMECLYKAVNRILFKDLVVSSIVLMTQKICTFLISNNFKILTSSSSSASSTSRFEIDCSNGNILINVTWNLETSSYISKVIKTFIAKVMPTQVLTFISDISLSGYYLLSFFSILPYSCYYNFWVVFEIVQLNHNSNSSYSIYISTSYPLFSCFHMIWVFKYPLNLVNARHMVNYQKKYFSEPSWLPTPCLSRLNQRKKRLLLCRRLKFMDVGTVGLWFLVAFSPLLLLSMGFMSGKAKVLF